MMDLEVLYIASTHAHRYSHSSQVDDRHAHARTHAQRTGAPHHSECRCTRAPRPLLPQVDAFGNTAMMEGIKGGHDAIVDLLLS